MGAMKAKNGDIVSDGGSAGGFIRSWRKERGMIQKQLARACGMSVPQLWAVESGRNSPSVKTLSRVASALGITLAQLFSPPNGRLLFGRRLKTPRSSLEFDGVGMVRIMRPAPGTRDIAKRDVKRLAETASKAFGLESKRQVDLPNTLPFSFPIAVTDGGAVHLAHALRARMDVGSAIVHDTTGLFETYGVRVVMGVDLPESFDALTYYSKEGRMFTVFLSGGLDDTPWRRDFAFLTEIGRAFVFASHGYEPFQDSAKSRRFAQHFAANFQLPESAVRMAVYSLRVEPDDWTLELLLRFKERFGVSAQSFNMRLKELGLITQARFGEFDAIIRRHRSDTKNGELMPETSEPGRYGDLAALERRP